MRSLRKPRITSRSWTKEKSYYALFLLLGFTLSSYFAFYLKRYCLLPFFILLSLVFFFFAHKKGKKALLLFSLSFALGFALFSIPIKTVSAGKVELSGIVTESKSNYFFFKSEGVTYYVYEKGNEREVGDVLLLQGYRKEFEETRYEGRFSFKDYLLTRGVKYSFSVYSSEERFLNPLRLRAKEKEFLSSFDSDTASLIDSLLFDHGSSDADALSDASSLGLSYLLRSSGVYFSILCLGVEKICAFFFDKRKCQAASLILLGALSPFYLFKLSYIRVMISRLLSFFFVNEKWGLDNLGKVSLTGLILLTFSYRNALRSAFLLGIGLMLNNAFLSSYFANLEKRKKKIGSTLSFRFFLLPLSLKSGVYHLFGLPYALFLPFLLFPFIVLSLLSFLTVPFSFLSAYSSFISSILSFCLRVDVSIPIFGEINEYAYLFYYLLYYSYFFLSRIGFHKLKRFAPLSFLSFLLLNYLPVSNLITEEVTFINVGQGDAILIRSGSNSVLIDTGGSNYFDMGSEVDVPYLRKKRIYHLDALILTHGDNDHDGGVNGIVNSFIVKETIREKEAFPLTIGNITLSNLNTYGGEEENDKSLVLYLELLGKKWLFMGDASSSIEQKIIADNPYLSCDIIKLGHHGSSTSSSMSFLKQVDPEVAIISVGAKNSYKHPSKEVISRLNSLGIKIRRTDEEGSITYKELKNA